MKAEEVQINNDDADGADDEFLSTGSRALKSEGDTPDCISEELAQMIADSVKLDMMKSKLHGQNNPDCWFDEKKNNIIKNPTNIEKKKTPTQFDFSPDKSRVPPIPTYLFMFIF